MGGDVKREHDHEAASGFFFNQSNDFSLMSAELNFSIGLRQ